MTDIQKLIALFIAYHFILAGAVWVGLNLSDHPPRHYDLIYSSPTTADLYINFVRVGQCGMDFDGDEIIDMIGEATQ